MQYEGLSISSGGNKGFAIMGALAYLQYKGCLKNIKKYSGCSIGSIITLLYAVGWTPIEMFKRAIKIKIFNSIADFDIAKMTQDYGFMDPDLMEKQLESMIIEKLGKVPTFLELHEMGIYYSCSSCDIDLKQGKKFDYITSPHLLCSNAAVASSNMPFVFPRYEIDGHRYLDGALTDPFPIDYIDDGKSKILGIVVYSAEKNYDMNIAMYASAVMMVGIEDKQKKSIAGSSKMCNILELLVNDVSVLDVRDAHGAKLKMFLEGLDSCKQFYRHLAHTDISENISSEPWEPKTYPSKLIDDCLMSMPIQMLGLCGKNQPLSLRLRLKKLPPTKIKLLEGIAEQILFDSLNEFHSTPLGETKIVDHSLKLFRQIPSSLQPIVKEYMNNMPADKYKSSVDGFNMVMEGFLNIVRGLGSPRSNTSFNFSMADMFPDEETDEELKLIENKKYLQ